MTPYQASQLSDISRNYNQYGYCFNDQENPSEWWREDIAMGFSDMLQYIEAVNLAVDSHPARRVGQHIGMSLQNLGVEFDEVWRTPASELLSQQRLQANYLDKILAYKRKILPHLDRSENAHTDRSSDLLVQQ